MIQDLCEVFADLSSVKPEIVEFTKNGVYAYNETFSKDYFIMHSKDELGIEFSMDYKLAAPIIERIKIAEDVKHTITEGVLILEGKNFRHEIPGRVSGDFPATIDKLLEKEIQYVVLEDGFKESVKFCGVLNKIGAKNKNKFVFVENGKMVATDGLVYLEHDCNVPSMAFTENTLNLIGKFSPTKLGIIDNGYFLDYNEFTVWIPKSANKISNPLNADKKKVIDVIPMIPITAEMVSKLGLISKITEFSTVKITVEKHQVMFQIPNRTSYEKCEIESDIEFTGNYNVTRILPFFSVDTMIGQVRFGDMKEGPLVFKTDNSMAMIMNMVN
jgi:hypothetical protein